SGELVSCLENSTSELPLSLVYPYSRYIPPSVRAFYDWSRTMLSHPDNRQ
ncbi:LysR family transcriptional regulator, partial [Klebsiella pneumoniae]